MDTALEHVLLGLNALRVFGKAREQILAYGIGDYRTKTQLYFGLRGRCCRKRAAAI